jgi:hypothetical protein
VLSTALALASAALAQGSGNEGRARRPEAVDLLKNCPQGHLVEFVLPGATLHVDMHWLASFSILDVFKLQGAECPKGPIRLKTLYFNRGVLGEPSGSAQFRGLRVLQLSVGGDSRSPQQPTRNADHEDGIDTSHRDAPWIEDLLLSAPWKGHYGPGTENPTKRIYRFHYPELDHTSPDRSVDISCSGEAGRPGSRSCAIISIGGASYGGLFIDYWLFQDQLAIPASDETTSTDPNTEPGLLLAFDIRLRARLSAMKRQP